MVQRQECLQKGLNVIQEPLFQHICSASRQEGRQQHEGWLKVLPYSKVAAGDKHVMMDTVRSRAKLHADSKMDVAKSRQGCQIA